MTTRKIMRKRRMGELKVEEKVKRKRVRRAAKGIRSLFLLVLHLNDTLVNKFFGHEFQLGIPILTEATDKGFLQELIDG